MFPNPQDALPLPQKPNLEQYRKLAKDLVRAAKTGEGAIRAWATRWITELVRQSGIVITRNLPVRVESWSKRVAEYAAKELVEKKTRMLNKAQFVIARSQGFESWPKFSKHLREMAGLKSQTSQFEAAADAIVSGDAPKLQRLLRENPGLVRARSTREHGATLLHYVSANGVEGYRQKTPKNIVEITKMLLDAGAAVDATCHVYGSNCTTLGLTATSIHPANEGTMNDLLQLLLERGAYMEKQGSAGRAHSLVFACLANGQPGAARFLASRGAPVDLVSAAALDQLELVQHRFNSGGSPEPGASQVLVQEAFRYACGYGAYRVVEFLLERGVDLAEHSGDGYTGTHYAVMSGSVETVKLLLGHHPPLEGKTTHGSSVLWHALWSATRGDKPDEHVQIVEALIGAGAKVPENHPPVTAKIDALLERYGSRTDPSWRWSEE
ncbi:MAG TPA: ankyrin repeat domain-containing protein [Candidatus Angelobacter sp.]